MKWMVLFVAVIATGLQCDYMQAQEKSTSVVAPDGTWSDQHILYMPVSPVKSSSKEEGIFVGPKGEFQFRCGHCTKFFRVRKNGDKDWSNWELIIDKTDHDKHVIEEALYYYRQRGFALQFTYIAAELPQ